MTEHARAVLGLNVKPFMRGLSTAKTGMSKFKAAMQSSLGFFGIGFGLATLGRSMTEFADKLIDTSRKLGISTDFLQAWNYAAQQNGVSVNASNMALQRFSRRIGEAARGQGVLYRTTQELGIQLRDSNGNMRDTIDILKDYANAIRDAEGPNERLRLAFQAFDSEGAALVTLLQDGADGIDNMVMEAHRLGVVVEREALIAINRLSNKLKGFAIIALGFVARKFGGFLDMFERGWALLGALSFGANLEEARKIANAQVDAKNKADELRRISETLTEQAEKQVALERQKVELLKRQADARRRLADAREDQSRTDLDGLADRNIAQNLREHVAINRSRAARVAALRRSGRHQEADAIQRLIDAGSGINLTNLVRQTQRARLARAHEQEGRRLAELGLFQPSQDAFATARQMRSHLSELTTGEQRPMAALEDAVTQSNSELQDLNQQVQIMREAVQQLNQ